MLICIMGFEVRLEVGLGALEVLGKCLVIGIVFFQPFV